MTRTRESPARGLADLPTEIILSIGSYSNLATLWALVLTQKRFAAILTTQLYDKGTRSEVHEDHGPVHGVFTKAMLHCAGNWNSPHVTRHVLSKMAGREFFCVFFAIDMESFDEGMETLDGDMETPILPLAHLMAAAGNTGILGKLLDGGGVGVRDSVGRTALHWAALRNREDVTRMLLNMGERAADVDKYSMTAIMLAARCGSPSFLGDIIQSAQAIGDDIFGVDWRGWTALHHAAKHGNTAVIPMLLELGADASIRDTNGEYPLLLAIKHSAQKLNKLVVSALIEASSDINMRNSVSVTPLQYAATTTIVWLNELLLEAGADIHLGDREGDTALHWALYEDIENPVVDLFIRYKADPYQSNYGGVSPLLLAIQEYNGTQTLRFLQMEHDPFLDSDIVEFDSIEYKLWQLTRSLPAIEVEQAQLVSDLIDMQSIPDFEEMFHQREDILTNSLHLLSSARDSPQTRPGLEATISLLLDACNTKFCVSDENGFTPLHYASYTGKAEAIEQFFIRGHNRHLSKYNGVKLNKQKRRTYAGVVVGLLEAGQKEDALVRDDNGVCGLDRWAMEIQDGLSFNVVNLLLGRQSIMAYIGETDDIYWFG
ncbi:hypothetical protein FQN53_005836 [Emmonsiellopsis sp. PD_33]|nr:hypothetical protein FQN53_005836 [Emmonsiellopsis sp. PD_33]